MYGELCDDVPCPVVDIPLAESVVTAHAVDRGLVRAELHVEYVGIVVSSPAEQVLLL